MLEKETTIIVPIYNIEPYLSRCLESLINQTSRDFVVYLIDDGSSDGSALIAREYERKYPGLFRYFYKENGGLSDARNFGISQATTKWLFFLDGDDYLTTDAIEKLHYAAKQLDVDICIGNWNTVLEDGSPFGKYPGFKNASGIKEGPEKIGLLYGPEYPYFVTAWNKLYKRELFADIHFEKDLLHEDEAIQAQLFAIAKHIGIVREITLKYVQRSGSITNTTKSFKHFYSIPKGVLLRFPSVVKAGTPYCYRYDVKLFMSSFSEAKTHSEKAEEQTQLLLLKKAFIKTVRDFKRHKQLKLGVAVSFEWFLFRFFPTLWRGIQQIKRWLKRN